MKTLKMSLVNYFQYEGWFRKLIPAIVVGSIYALSQILMPFFQYFDNQDLGLGKTFINSSSSTLDTGIWSILGGLLVFLSAIVYIVIILLYTYENTKAAIDGREPKSIIDVSFSENLDRFGRFLGAGLFFTIILIPFYCVALAFFAIIGVGLAALSPILLLFLCPFAIVVFVLVLVIGFIFVQPSILRMIDEDKFIVVTEVGKNYKFGWANKEIFARLFILVIFALVVGFVFGFINGIFIGIASATEVEALYIPVFILYTIATTAFTTYLALIVQPKFQAEIYKRAVSNSPVVND